MITSVAQLKRECQNYTWNMFHHDWFKGQPNKLIGLKRRVEFKNTAGVRFEGGSYLDYPKADDVEFVDNNDGTFNVIITISPEGAKMSYNLELL